MLYVLKQQKSINKASLSSTKQHIEHLLRKGANYTAPRGMIWGGSRKREIARALFRSAALKCNACRGLQRG